MDRFNVSSQYPDDSPLRHDRTLGVDHVAAEDGVYIISVAEGDGDYEGELRVIRSGLAENSSSAEQIIFLDFEAGEVDLTEVLGGVFPGFDPVRNLSPLSTVLERWDLTADDEDAVIDAAIDTVVNALDTDLRVRDGRNGDRDRTGVGREFDVTVLNSRDHGEQWGKPNVTRVIIGGTIDELGLRAFALPQSTDVGNTDTEETGIQTFDPLSEPLPSEEIVRQDPPRTINALTAVPPYTKADLVGRVLGAKAASLVGQMLGNYWQDPRNEVVQVMDAPFSNRLGSGGFAGTGPDLILGTADDQEVTFGDTEDELLGNVLKGVQDSSARTVFALSTGTYWVPPTAGQPS